MEAISLTFSLIAKLNGKKAAQKEAPNPIGLRGILFWGIDAEKIDFENNRIFVIPRAFERGNEAEINEIIRFYGAEPCISIINKGNSVQCQ